MCLTAWLLLQWIDGTTTAAREGCSSLYTDRVINEGGLDLCTFPSDNQYLSHHAKTIVSDRWIPRGVSFQRPRHRLIAVASLGRLPRNRSIRVWFTRYPRTDLSDRWRSLGITSLRNIGGIRYVCTSIPTSAIMTKHASSHVKYSVFQNFMK
ncbi:hypothetical protein TNCV_323921 [Trichonephila clavipes]|nr:hypothetical protein TNCV_323921 [Trichonephila clavipes]